MASAPDKFARLSALRPVEEIRRHTAGFEAHFKTASAADTEEECMLARMIGATISQNKFGCHLTVSNWHAIPAFCEPSAGVIELLEKAGAAPKKSRAVVSARR